MGNIADAPTPGPDSGNTPEWPKKVKFGWMWDH